MKKIVIAGGTGTIGRELTKQLAEKGYETVIITRSPVRLNERLANESYEKWPSGTERMQEILRGAYGVINLAGASVADNAWNAAGKSVLLDSRLHSTRLLVKAINGMAVKPDFFFNASAMGYYGDTGEEETYAGQGEQGEGFLAGVCGKWEAEAKLLRNDVRLIIGRFSNVLSAESGILAVMSRFIRRHLGVHIGSGRQWTSWIDVQDCSAAVIYLIETGRIGTYDITSPSPLRMEMFLDTLASALNRHIFLRAPVFFLKAILGERSELLLFSQRISGNNLAEAGFVWQFETLEKSLDKRLTE